MAEGKALGGEFYTLLIDGERVAGSDKIDELFRKARDAEGDEIIIVSKTGATRLRRMARLWWEAIND